MIKSRQEQLQLICEVENKLLQLESSNIDLFPVIRAYIFYSYKPIFDQKKPKRSIVQWLGLLYQFVLSFFRLLVLCIKPIKSDYLLVASSLQRNSLNKTVWISKHLDSLIRHYGKHNCTVIEIGKSKPGVNSPYLNLTKAVRGISKLVISILPKNKVLSKLALDSVRAVKAIDPNANMNAQWLENELNVFCIATKIYKLVFTRSHFKMGVWVAYYDFEMMAMINALNSRGVKTVDYQHGIQNDFHALYSGWEALPKRPNCMPTTFFVWDKITEQRILKWGELIGVTAEITGNFWLRLILPTSNAGKELDSKKSLNEVLVALQHWPEDFNEELLEVIKNKPQLNWCFRAHPFAPISEHDNNRICAQYPNIRFETNEARTLEEALSSCTLCITGYSTVGIEALHFGKTTIYTHVNALDGLTSYIDNKVCYFAREANELESIVTSVFDN